MSSFHWKGATNLNYEITFQIIFDIKISCNFSPQKSYLTFINHYKHNTTKNWLVRRGAIMTLVSRNFDPVPKNLNNVLFNVLVTYTNRFNPLSANPSKWSNTLKQFVGCCRRIVWVWPFWGVSALRVSSSDSGLFAINIFHAACQFLCPVKILENLWKLETGGQRYLLKAFRIV